MSNEYRRVDRTRTRAAKTRTRARQEAVALKRAALVVR